MDLLFIAAGLVFLFLGGEALVRGATTLAQRLGVSSLLIGLVVVGFGTSTPELLVSLQAALDGAPDIAVGNVVGSNIANILLIGGLAALLAPFAAKQQFPIRDLAVMTAASLIMMALAWSGSITRLSGAFMLAALAGYLWYTFVASQRESAAFAAAGEQGSTQAGRPGTVATLLAIVFVVVGLGALMQGASLLVHGATAIARDWGISEAVIGLTIVAVGTSLPELATTIVAAIRRNSAIAIGNIIGSNIFNVLGILGITAMVSPLAINPEIARFDAPVMLVISIALALALLGAPRLGRLAGALAIASYTGYTLYLFM